MIIRLLALLFLAFTWGSSFILMKRAMFTPGGYPVYTPAQVATLRLMVAGLTLLPLSWLAWKQLKREDLKWIAVVGILGSGIPAFLFTTAQSHYISSSLAGILNSLTPLFTLLAGKVVFGRKATARHLIGVLCGLAGAALLVLFSQGTEVSGNWWALLIVAATISYGLGVNTVQFRLAHIRPLNISATGLSLVSLLCTPLFFVFNVPETFQQNEEARSALVYVLILGLAGTAVATAVYFWLAQRQSALFASSVTYLIPIVAVAWGLADGEDFNRVQGIGAMCILAGVYLVSRNGLKKRGPAG